MLISGGMETPSAPVGINEPSAANNRHCTCQHTHMCRTTSVSFTHDANTHNPGSMHRTLNHAINMTGASSHLETHEWCSSLSSSVLRLLVIAMHVLGSGGHSYRLGGLRPSRHSIASHRRWHLGWGWWCPVATHRLLAFFNQGNFAWRGTSRRHVCKRKCVRRGLALPRPLEACLQPTPCGLLPHALLGTWRACGILRWTDDRGRSPCRTWAGNFGMTTTSSNQCCRPWRPVHMLFARNLPPFILPRHVDVPVLTRANRVLLQ